MFTFLSLVTSIKDYVEVVHKLIETDANFTLTSYYDFGSIFTFVVLTGKEFLKNVLTFQWFQNFWSIPTVVPDVASSLISEISVFDGSLKNTQTFFETPFSYGNQNFLVYCIEKFIIGFLNSIFLCFPTSISHLITLRRFVMQGLEAGFLSGLGTITGNLVWIASILFGFRFLVIPWLSLDLFRFFLGFLLIVKYMWDSARERRMVLEDFSKYKIFFLTFLLSFTEQTTIFPFISNLSFGSDATFFESFPTENFSQFAFVHCCYLLGLLLGSLSFLQFTCWFWENPAFQIYMWFLSSFQITKSISSKFVNFIFLYATMLCAISNFSYFGLDYTLTNPLGFVHEDRLFEQKAFLETAFLNTKASDRNTRRNRGRHGRRERWKRRVRRYRTFDASMYDQGIYDLFTIEDLNYGFDRFWLRRKIRNHRVRFRFFPGPWMRSFKKQLSRPRLESFLGPRVEFFRILFEQAYHPEFHEFSSTSREKKNLFKTKKQYQILSPNFFGFGGRSEADANSDKTQNFLENVGNGNFISWNLQKNKKQRFLKEHSTFRKFVRKIQNRVKRAKIENEIQNSQNLQLAFENSQNLTKPISSKMWKKFAANENRKFPADERFSQNGQNASFSSTSEENFLFGRFSNKLFFKNEKTPRSGWMKKDLKKHLSKKDLFVQRYKMFLASEGQNKSAFSNQKTDLNQKNTLLFSSAQTFNTAVLSEESSGNSSKKQTSSESLEALQNASQYRPLTFFHPLQFYFQKEQAFKRKFQFYGVKLFRNFGVENNAPYFRVFLKRFFYHYKPSLRWERTLRVATYRRARRKTSRIPRKFNVPKSSQILAQIQSENSVGAEQIEKNRKSVNTNEAQAIDVLNHSGITDPTHFYSLVDKRASRYRFQIYKDVLQHWYYSPLNRLLLKLDVDAFIRRQPNSYFLTKNDEKFLHLKRQLLSEYYESLRWYTSMEHYTTMKNQIGGTKSLSTRAYNQQFTGTFKKIRHLFNITPSFRDSTVLKFDQPLYNEYKKSKNGRVFDDSVLHEEFVSDNFFFVPDSGSNQNNSKTVANPENLVNQSLSILRDYLSTAAPLRQQYIERLLQEKNYWELTQFFFRGQKMRGTRPISNETDFLNQEKRAFLENTAVSNTQNSSFLDESAYGLQDELWIALLKKCQRKLYDQEALKNYVTLKKEKYEMQKQRHEKYLKIRFQRIKDSVLENPELFLQKTRNKNLSQHLSNAEKKKIEEFENFSGYPSSLNKALKESFLWENNSLASSSFQTLQKLFGSDRFVQRGKKVFLQKTNLRKNQFPAEQMYESFDGKPVFSNGLEKRDSTKLNTSKLRAHIFAKNLQFSVKKQALQILQSENKLVQRFENSSNKSGGFSIPRIFLSVFQNTKKILLDGLRLKNVFRAFRPGSLNHEKRVPFLSSRKDSNIFSSTESKDFEFWKKRETILAKRKKLRKTFKRLRNQKSETNKISFEKNDFFMPLSVHRPSATENRQKMENYADEREFLKTQKAKSSRVWKKYVGGESQKEREQKGLFQVLRQTGFGEKKFQKRRSRLRRYSSFKGRGPIKKRTLREKLKRQFKSLKRYGRNQNTFASEQIAQEREKKKVELIQYITQRKYEADGKFLQRDEKQRRTRQSKHRAWKKKKQNFAQKRRKLRKRRRSTVSKIRVFNKKISRILSRKEVQTWWWKTFFPHFQKTTEKTWQLQKNIQIRKQLVELSEKEILERDKGNISSLQIGDKDSKPFAIPEALRIREKLVQENILRFGNEPEKFNENQSRKSHIDPKMKLSTHDAEFTNTQGESSKLQSGQIFENVNRLVFNEEKKSENLFSKPLLVPTNSLPFYAGWDEGLRKFVLTNRYLSRKEAFSFSKTPENSTPFTGTRRSPANQSPEFQQSPLQGMNAATTLYWQIPFTTYDPDQFFALGMDGFSPIGWRNFSLNHSKQTTKPMLVKNILSFNEESPNFSKNLQYKLYEQSFKTSKGQKTFFVPQKNEIEKNFEYRRILKKQKRLKKHPRPPVWFPSGSLSQQVLPVHYIYVFYKRSRLPRDRYIRRRLRSKFLNNENFQPQRENSMFADRTRMVDFTLRKRTKPRRKYHRKRFRDLSEKNQFFARRRKFRGFQNETETARPSSKIFQTSTLTSTKLDKRIFQSKQRLKIQDSKQPTENLRVRQLRRRVQRQVYRPIWRSRPRAGGFVWPGDYLRLELVKASPLKSTNVSLGSAEQASTEKMDASQNARKIRKKTRRTLQEWQIQPKRYLVEKHNLKVLKTRLEKSMNINDFSS